MINKLRFETFTEFCRRADEILDTFIMLRKENKVSNKEYKKYIYENHKFSDNQERDLLIKDKCWSWMMSSEYEVMCKNDLYSVLGQLKKGN